jgi:hypothetical protein
VNVSVYCNGDRASFEANQATWRNKLWIALLRFLDEQSIAFTIISQPNGDTASVRVTKIDCKVGSGEDHTEEYGHSPTALLYQRFIRDSLLSGLKNALPYALRLVFEAYFVSEAHITVKSSEDSTSYFVMLSLPVTAAKCLCLLARAKHCSLQELGIVAVLFGGECIGMDRLALDEKLRALPDSSCTRVWWARSVELAKLAEDILANVPDARSHISLPAILGEKVPAEPPQPMIHAVVDSILDDAAAQRPLAGTEESWQTFDDWLDRHGLCTVAVDIHDAHCQFRAERIPRFAHL